MPEIKEEKWWQEGLQLAAELTGWLVIPIIGALIVGKWLDQYYNSAPWLFLTCTAVAFAITCSGIIYKATVWMKNITNNQSPTERKTNDQNKRN